MNTCKHCLYFQSHPYPEIQGKWQYPRGRAAIPPVQVSVGDCTNPLLVCENTEATPINGLRADSGYDYSEASITVGEAFGCIHFTPKS